MTAPADDPALDWSKLRVWDHSKQAGFEQLCAMLAEGFDVPKGSVYRRNGRPDGGVECTWTLPTGEVWGWQAKFFLDPLDSSELGQIQESLKTALKAHPKLRRYYVCIPRDLSSGNVARKKSERERWEKRAEAWRQLPSARALHIELWGSHQLGTQLLRERNAGLRRVWFSELQLSAHWFSEHRRLLGVLAHPRYLPGGNVHLPIGDTLRALAKSPRFAEVAWAAHDRVAELAGDLVGQTDAALDPYRPAITELASMLETALDERPSTFDPAHILALCSRIESAARGVAHEIDREAADAERQKTGAAPAPTGATTRHARQRTSDGLRSLSRALVAFEAALPPHQMHLAAGRPLLLVGDAGVGKTHLFCDFANARSADAATIVVLGASLNAENLWASVLRKIGLERWTHDELLGALAAVARATGKRALVLVDALNEIPYRADRADEIAAFAATFAPYAPWVGLGMSVRSGLERSVVRADLTTQFVRVEHPGLRYAGAEAFREFCSRRGVQVPVLPALPPQFGNTLFVHLVCEGVRAEGGTTLPETFVGLEPLLDKFVARLNERVSGRDGLNVSTTKQVVPRALQELAAWMADNQRDAVPQAVAEEICEAIAPNGPHTEPLLMRLVAESAVAPQAASDAPDQSYALAFQLLRDHLVAKAVAPAGAALEEAEARLATLLKVDPTTKEPDIFALLANRGVVALLSVTIPRRFDKESLPTLLPQTEATLDAFVEGLMWRDGASLGPSALALVDVCARSSSLRRRVFEVRMRFLSVVGHPLNAEWLHDRLFPMAVADRDARWSIPAYELVAEGDWGPIRSLVDYAWSNPSALSPERASLLATGLAWLLTTPHRGVRDDATKALVSLLTPRPSVVEALLTRFADVNDPYVSERIYAVVCGVVMRARDLDAARRLADLVERYVFDAGPPPNILTRDFAAAAVEAAVARADYEARNDVRAPGRCEWPGLELMTADEIEACARRAGANKKRGARALHASIMHLDFARYIIGTNSQRDGDFLTSRLGERRARSPKAKAERAGRRLPKAVATAVENYLDAISAGVIILPRLEREDGTRDPGPPVVIGERAPPAKGARRALLAKLTALGKKDLLLRAEKAILNKSWNEEPRVLLEDVQRYVFTRVIELGWTAERFDDFDAWIGSHDREGAEPDRIGKKYQWIAYHEAIARLADTHHFSRRYDELELPYVGPWQVGARTLDPSQVFRAPADPRPLPPAWWTPPLPAQSVEPTKESLKAWLGGPEGFPSVESLVRCKDADGTRWLVLDGIPEWHPGSAWPRRARQGRHQPRLYAILRAYLVPAASLAAVVDWADKQDFMGRWMPEPVAFTDAFAGEFFHGARYEVGRAERGDPLVPERLKPPPGVVFAPTSEHYGWDARGSRVDAGNVSAYFACREIVQELQLDSRGEHGRFYDRSGTLVAEDPSVRTPGHHSLVIREDAMKGFLARRGMALVWAVLMEKIVSGEAGGVIDGCPRVELSGVGSFDGREVHGRATVRSKGRESGRGVVARWRIDAQGAVSRVRKLRARKANK